MPTSSQDEPAKQIVILPTAPQHASGVEQLFTDFYHQALTDDDAITTEKILTHLALFPEGQYVALDPANERVVGATLSMRMAFDPAVPFTEAWHITTDYG